MRAVPYMTGYSVRPMALRFSVFDRQRDPAVVADVAHLAVLRKVGRHDLVAVETDPYHCYLRTAVRVQGHEVSQGRGLRHRSGAVGDRCHEMTLAVLAVGPAGGWLPGHQRRTMECRRVCTQGRQGESAPASGKRSAQPGVDRGCQVVVPLGFASLADRLWAHGQAATVH